MTATAEPAAQADDHARAAHLAAVIVVVIVASTKPCGGVTFGAVVFRGLCLCLNLSLGSRLGLGLLLYGGRDLCHGHNGDLHPSLYRAAYYGLGGVRRCGLLLFLVCCRFGIHSVYLSGGSSS